MPPVQSFDLLVAVSRQSNLYFILAVPRKGIGNQYASASAYRQAIDVLFLRSVRPDTKSVTTRRTVSRPDRKPADLLRRRDITVEQCRGKITYRHVVKTIARFVTWQQRRGVDVQCEKVANRVLVFGSIEPPKRSRSAGVRMIGGSFVQRSLQRRQDLFVTALRWPAFLFGRRHLPRAKLIDHLFPLFPVLADVIREKDRFEIEIPLLRIVVMTIEAKLFKNGFRFQPLRPNRAIASVSPNQTSQNRKNPPSRSSESLGPSHL